MTSVTTVSAVEKLNPSQRLRAHLQHICRGPARKILPWGPWVTRRWSYCASSPSLILPHRRAHRKEQSSNYFAVSLLQRWITTGRNKYQKCKEVHEKEGEDKHQQRFAKCNTPHRIPTPARSMAEAGQVLHAQGQRLFPARCPSKTHRAGRACSPPNIINPPKP